MRDSVPSTRYSSVCNVLHEWNILLIPTYRVYRLYDNYIILTVHNKKMWFFECEYNFPCKVWILEIVHSFPKLSYKNINSFFLLSPLVFFHCIVFLHPTHFLSPTSISVIPSQVSHLILSINICFSYNELFYYISPSLFSSQN